MPGKYRNTPTLPMTSARLLDILAQIYDLQAGELDWLRSIGEAMRPIVDCGGGVNVVTWNLDPTRSHEGTRVGLGHDIEVMWTQFSRVVPLEILTDEALCTPISNAARCLAPRIRRYADAGHAAMGVQSLTAINGLDLENHKVSVGIPQLPRGCAFWPERDRALWERISAHLGAAFRMRHHGAARATPSLVIDHRGRVQHADPDLAAGAELAQLRQAVAAVDRARRIRMPPEAVLDAWRALHGARWSIVESVERNGRRLLVARPNVPLHAADPSVAAGAAGRHQQQHPRKLSAMENRVLVALSESHSNKLIAYELGLATSTVSTLLARAARKLGCRSRIELARAGRALTYQVANQHIAREPA